MAAYHMLSGIGDKSKKIATTFLKIFLYSFLIILAIVIIKGILKTDELVIQPISAPQAFVQSGYQGHIISQRLHEEIESIYQNSTTVREDSTAINVDQSKDINMNVMGLGVSASNIIYHLRDLLGIQTNYITGHLTDMNSVLNLKLSVSNPSHSRTISLPYVEGQKLQVFDSLLFEGAKFITQVENPYRLAVFYYQKNQYDKALEIVRKLTKSPGEKQWAYNLWGNIIKTNIGLGESVEFYQQALSEDPNFELALRNLGMTYLNLDSLDLAINYLQKAYRLDETNWQTVNLLAHLNSRQGQVEEANTFYKINMDQHPKNMYSYANYGEFLMRNDQADELPKLFEIAKAQNFENDDFYIIQSGYYSFLGKLDSAEIFAEKALLFNPSNIDALARKANIVYERDGNVASIPYMKKVLNQFEKQNITGDGIINTLNTIAVAEYTDGQLDSAHYHITKAINLEPSVALLYSTLAEVQLLKGSKEQFYQTMTIAFEKGLTFSEDWWEDMPYDQLKTDKRLLAMIKKYNKSTEKLKG